MEVGGKRLTAASRSPPRTSVEGGNSPVVAPRGPPSVLETRQGGSLAFAPSAAAAQSFLSPAAATSAGRFPAMSSSVRPHWIGFSPSESAPVSPASSSRVMSDRSTDEHIVRRVSVPDSSMYDDHQRRRYVQQQRKQRRPYHSTDSPPHDSVSFTVTPSTSWHERSSNVFASSSSSFLPHHRHHHHLGSYRFSPFLHRTSAVSAVGPSFTFSPWSVELSPTRSTVGPVTASVGAIGPPVAYPVIRADTHLSPRPVGAFHDMETECQQRHPQQHPSISGTDKPSSFTAVSQHCTPHDRLIFSGGGGAYQLDEGMSSLIGYNNKYYAC